jgi:2'-5' RNA ligase
LSCGKPAAQGLRLLQRPLGHRLALLGIHRAGWSFNPHVTLLYRAGEGFQRDIQPLRWEALEIVLIHSIVGETGHEELGRWTLIRRQQSLAF